MYPRKAVVTEILHHHDTEPLEALEHGPHGREVGTEVLKDTPGTVVSGESTVRIRPRLADATETGDGGTLRWLHFHRSKVDGISRQEGLHRRVGVRSGRPLEAGRLARRAQYGVLGSTLVRREGVHQRTHPRQIIEMYYYYYPATPDTVARIGSSTNNNNNQ